MQIIPDQSADKMKHATKQIVAQKCYNAVHKNNLGSRKGGQYQLPTTLGNVKDNPLTTLY